MTADRVALTDGYEGAYQHEKGLANEGESLSHLARMQNGNTESLLSQNSGGFATQLGNGSTGVANTHQAQALLDTNNAAEGTRYLTATAGHEEEAAHSTGAEARLVDQGAQDIIMRINGA